MEQTTLRTAVMDLALALDPKRQARCWPDPIAWDGRPLTQQAADLLVIADIAADEDVAAAADRVRAALGM